MATLVYPKAQARAADGGVGFSAGTIKIYVLTAAYTYSSSHEFVTDLGATIVARSGALTSKTNTVGASGTTLDAADATLTAPAAGSTFTQAVLVRDTGADATSELIAKYDVASTLTNGNDISLVLNASGLITTTSP